MTHVSQHKPLTLAVMPRTMSSLEIAALTGKRHDHVLRDIREMLLELYPNPDKVVDPDTVDADGDVGSNLSRCAPKSGGTSPDKGRYEIEVSVPGPNGGHRAEIGYALPKRETLVLISGYSITVRAAIIDRWLELEANHAQFRADIQTLSTSADRESSWAAALRLAQKQLLAATNQKALRTIRSGLEHGIPAGFTPASFATATLEFYNKNAAKLQKLDTPDAKTTLALLKDVDLAFDTPDKVHARGLAIQTVSWSHA